MSPAVASAVLDLNPNPDPDTTGTVELDAHTAILTLCVFLFISFPFGVATASTIRVGNLLGAGQPQQARLAGAYLYPISYTLLYPMPYTPHLSVEML